METMFNNGMCRCCASEGTFKDLSTKYRWMGVDEVYADMLRECFDVTLSAADESAVGGICEVCITQLRNAANFKKQVLNTEEQFKRVLLNKPFQSNIVKVEAGMPDDELRLTDEDNHLSNDDFSGNEFEVPIKTESSEEGKSRKRGRAGSSRGKASKRDGETSAKRIGSGTGVGSESLREHGVAPVRNKCMACDKSFVNRSRLLAHRRRDHLLERRHECDQCDKKFFLMKELIIHRVTHTGEKLFECDVCLKSYGRKSNLRQHMRIHEDDRRFKCEICVMAFVQKCSLKSHMKSKHGIMISS